MTTDASLTKITCIEAKMAEKKRTRKIKRRAKSDIPGIAGKVVEAVELRSGGEGYEIGILFTDRTYLGFEVDSGLTIQPILSDWKTGNYRPLRHFPIIHTR